MTAPGRELVRVELQVESRGRAAAPSARRSRGSRAARSGVRRPRRAAALPRSCTGSHRRAAAWP
eukprot:6163629-Lingulodinium_polyedra.AAC.1